MTHPQSLLGRVLAEPHDVWAWLDERCQPLAGESVEVRESVNRVTAVDAVAAGPVPASALAATDGFAVMSTATVGAGEYNPLPMRAGEANRVTPGSASRVRAGTPLPDGADAVLSLEDAQTRGGFLEVTTPLAAGENVVPAGREVAAGGVIVPRGHRLRPRDIAMLLVAGVDRVDVVRRPRVDIVCARAPSLDACAVLVRDLLGSWGCEVSGIHHAGDDPGRFGELLTPGATDLVVTIGGTGCGDDDFAVETLARVGEIAFHGIAVNPGEHAAAGCAGSRVVIASPGAPLQCLVIMELFVRRAVRALSGMAPARKHGITRARLSRKIASRPGRLDVCRVSLEGDEARPLAIADATTLATAVRADGYVLVPVRSEGYDAGSLVDVCLFDH